MTRHVATITAGMQSSTRVCTLVVARQLELQLYLPSVLGYLFVTLFSACELPLGAARPLIAWDTRSKPPWRAIMCAMGQRLHVVCSWQRPCHANYAGQCWRMQRQRGLTCCSKHSLHQRFDLDTNTSPLPQRSHRVRFFAPP